jgi:hypothetical protein
MDTSHILKPTATVSNSIFSKIRKFFFAAFIAEFVVGNGIYAFIINLNKKGLLGLDPEFDFYQMLWGDSLWLNILHLIIIGFTAGVFGFIFGYRSRRVSLSEKILFTFFYVFIRLIFLVIISVVIDFFLPSIAATWNEVIGLTIYTIASSTFDATFVILGYVVMFASAFYFIDKGSKLINDPYYTTDKSINGTLLDIKWYHYLWLWIPISFYTQILLNLLYKVGHTIVTLFTNFKWHTIFGGSDGGKGNALDVAWGSLFFIFIVVMIVIYLMDYLRKVLSGETDQHWGIKLLISLGIGIVIPFLILFFTSLAG